MIPTWTVCTTSAGWTASARSSTPTASRCSPRTGSGAPFECCSGRSILFGGPNGKFRHSIERMDPAHYLSSPVLRALADRRHHACGRGGCDHPAGTRSPRGRPFPAVTARPWRPARRPHVPNHAEIRDRRHGAGARATSTRPHPRASLRPGQARDHRARRRGGGNRRHRGTRRRFGHRSSVFGALHVPRIVGRGRHTTATFVHVDLFERYLQEA